MAVKQKDIEELVRLLAEQGYPDAMRLIMEDLIPVARKHHISLYESIKKYIEVDWDKETDFYKFGQAYWKISRRKLSKLNIHEPL